MSKFSVGDKVVRKSENLGGYWEPDCKQRGVDTAAVFTVNKPGTYLGLAELPGQWLSTMFRLATDLEIHQNSALPVEDHIAENNAHIECLRDLLEVEKQRVATLQDTVAELQAEVSRCCGTVADKEKMQQLTEELKQELTAAHFTIDNQATNITELKRLLADANLAVGAISTEREVLKRAITNRVDERDAAVLAAKTLGDEVQHLRQERREYRMSNTELLGGIAALDAGVADIDLLVLSSQLDQIGRMCDEQGNGADAKLAFDAAQVVDMVGRTLNRYADE